MTGFYPTAELVPRDIFEISKGNVPGHELVTITSTNPSLTGTSDIWDVDVPLVPPTGAETLEMVTTGADTIAGTGAQKVTMVYLDTSWNEQTTVTDTNAGIVSITTTNFYRHQSSFVTKLGDGVSNANNIDIRVAGGGAIRGRILAPVSPAKPSNTTRASHYTVPLGKTVISVTFYADSKKGDDADVELYVTNGDDGIFTPVFPVSVYQTNNSVVLKGSRQIPEKSDIKAVATTAVGPVKISFVLQMVLMDNEQVNNA